MLNVLTSLCLQNRLHAVTTAFTPQVRRCTESNTPLLQILTALTSSNPRVSYLYRRFFCSDVSEPNSEAASEARQAEGETEAAAIVPTVFRPEECLTVVALPLPHIPLFPGFYMPIYVKDPKLLAALVQSRKRQAPYAGAFLIKAEQGTDNPNVDTEKNIYEIKVKDLFKRLHEVGTLAQITSIQGDQVILIGHRRIRMTELVSEEPLTVKVGHLKEQPYNKDDDVLKATSFEVLSTLRDVLKTSSLWKDHVQTYIQHIGDFNYARLADFGAAISGANKVQCQQVLEELDMHKRLQLTLEIVRKEIEISKIQESIAKEIEEKISGEQRRYLLNEQLKATKKELGLESDDKTTLSAKFRESYSDENFDALRAEKILDEDHYGLSYVKERILEFIAVGKLRGTSQGKIICLSGPPGVGKTSIGRSIARALNRKFYRFSVGGLSDVAEIKGHRRTYIGAMPGKMVQCLKSVGTANPLVLIDEIDKMGRGHAGDPASAMLELLDPEQNANFLDHYLDVPIDLSKVLFVCTTNVLETIPNPLLDKMKNNMQKQIEKIYRKIALQLVTKDGEIEPHNAVVDEVKAESVHLSDEIQSKEETQTGESAEGSNDDKSSENVSEAEAPVNQMQKSTDEDIHLQDTQETEKAIESEASKTIDKVVVDSPNLADYVGKPVFHAERIYDQTPVGAVMGLAWTSMGGSTLYIETSLVE
ncbi:hypothetical protein K7X08_006088 [Anisodus acutangulus]|uniref:endopeptidase La n=1 Tax=Anisodus acutangulus TaxID=402998 RepID=A0A9Q1LS66_9SOLA|nr:hypothetical protein K7X08_006088 [Anisodus acutangulus]